MSFKEEDLPEDVSFKLSVEEPSEALLDKAKQILGETGDKRVCAIQELSDVIYESGEVVPHRMDDAFLLKFLRAKYFSVDKAHKLLIRYYKFRENNSSLIDGVMPWDDKLLYIASEEIISVLPYRDQHGRRTMLFKLGKWNTSECGVEDIFKATLMLLELAVLEQQAQVVGGVCFFDMENLSLQQAWQITPSVADKVIQLMGGSFPIRVPEIHIVNQPWVFETVFAIFKPFLDEKMTSKIHFHGTDFEKLHTFIDPKYLPENYGGTRPNYPHDLWWDRLSKSPHLLQELKKTGYTVPNEKLKLKEQITKNEK